MLGVREVVPVLNSREVARTELLHYVYVTLYVVVAMVFETCDIVLGSAFSNPLSISHLGLERLT